MAAALDISAVLSHSLAADELAHKGRFARAAEKYASAAQAGRALGAPECLVVANLQIHEAGALLSASNSETPERAHALRHRIFLELLPPLMALVVRRRCADTLLYGKCAPHEVEWLRQVLAASHVGAPSRTELLGQFIGYDSYLRVAHLGLFWMIHGWDPSAVVPPTAAQLEQIIGCASAALDLMSAPRPATNESFGFEAALLSQACDTLNDDSSPLSRMHRDALAAALGRLAASGVLEERGMGEAVQGTRRSIQRVQAKAKAEKDAPGLRSCTHCGAQEIHAAQFKRCSACKTVVFCKKDCQLANWPAHKAACKAARKAAEGAAAGA